MQAWSMIRLSEMFHYAIDTDKNPFWIGGSVILFARQNFLSPLG